METLVEFNVLRNVGAEQLSDRVPPYVYRFTLQAAVRMQSTLTDAYMVVK